MYLFRNDKLEQLTHDHTLVADLKEQGKITDEEAFVHPQRNILLQALGVEETVNADFFSFRLQEGDRLLLCSDGLSDMLRAAEISRIIGCAIRSRLLTNCWSRAWTTADAIMCL